MSTSDSPIAVLGVLTTQERSALRQEARATWLPRTRGTALLARFVLRGGGASAGVRAEALAHEDMLFVDAPAAASRQLGPLLSLRLWLAHAHASWPSATFVGKADDDVWFDPPRVLALLRETAPPASQVMWGVLERFHWDLKRRLPAQPFAYGLGMKRRAVRPRRCAEGHVTAADWTTQQRLGPFAFPKGPLFFLSRGLVAQLLGSAWAQAEWRSTEATVEATAAQPAQRRGRRALPRGNWMPWEDVLVGMALSRVARGGGLLALNLGQPFFSEGHVPAHPYGGLRRSTLILHAKKKVARHLTAMEGWAARHGCAPRVTVGCRQQPHKSCAPNATWRYCQLDVADGSNGTCPTGVVASAEVKREFDRAAV